MGCVSAKFLTKKFEDDYSIGPQLGTGAFGRVHVGHNIKTKQTVAIKIMNRKGLSAEDEQIVRDEVKVLKDLDHAHIIRLFDFFEEPDKFILILELCDGGELLDKIAEKETYSEKEARDLCHILLDAVAYLHERQIVHRDLKPENLLLTSSKCVSTIKIGDFGLAERVDSHLIDLCGTPNYMAPEIIKGEKYGVEVDCWSIGVIIFILLGGSTPFRGKTQKALFTNIVKGEVSFPSDPWDAVTDDAKDLIRGLLTVDPSKRLTAEEALNHRWMKAQSRLLLQRSLEGSLIHLKSFNARRKLKAAVEAVRISNRLLKLGSFGSIKEENSSRSLEEEVKDDVVPAHIHVEL